MRFRTLMGIILIRDQHVAIVARTHRRTIRAYPGANRSRIVLLRQLGHLSIGVQCRRLGGWRRNGCRASRLRSKVVSRRGTHRLRRRYWEADIKVLNLADLTVYKLTSDPALDGAPAWSPDGSKIAFVSDRTGIPELTE